MATVVLYGVGAIGGLVAGRLALAGHTVHLVARADVCEAVRRDGLCLDLPGGERLIARTGLTAHTRLADALAAGKSDAVILAVKSYDTSAAAEDLRAAGAGLPPVLTLQNGVGNEEALAAVLGAQRIIAGAITFPVSHGSGPGAVVLERRRGGVGLAGMAAPVPVELAQALSAASLAARVYADYRALKWSKLVMNLLANASAAILDLASVDVMADAGLFALEVAALREALAVMRALHIRVVDLPGYPVPLLALALRYAPLWLLQRVLGPLVGGSRGRKPPSLRLDLRRGRSEVAWLNGAVVRYGAPAGVATPANRVLAESLARVLAGEAPPGAGWRSALLAGLG